MSINDSILNSVGLTDPNIKFIISKDGEFNKLVPYGHDHHLVLRYRATLTTSPESCPNCGRALTNHFYRAGTDTAEYKLPTTNGYQHILSLTKQRYQCCYCTSTFVAQSKDFMTKTSVSRPLLQQIIDLTNGIFLKNIAYILHLSPSKVNHLMHHAAETYQTNYDHPLSAVICVDEFHYAKYQYSFEMVDGKTSDLIELFPNRTNNNYPQIFIKVRSD